MEANRRPTLLPGFSVLITAALLLNLSFGQEGKKKEVSSTTPTVLFICEHRAAKSVIAAAYFNKLAKAQRLNYRAAFRGVNPDPALNPVAERELKQDGIDTSDWKPTRLVRKDVDEASQIVTLVARCLPELTWRRRQQTGLIFRLPAKITSLPGMKLSQGSRSLLRIWQKRELDRKCRQARQ